MNGSPQPNEFLSVLYHALRATRRRCIIRHLRENRNKEVTTRELAREVASFEQDMSRSKVSGEPYRNAYNALSQTHLPTLSEAGIIIYDSNRQTVSTGENFDLSVILVENNATTVELFLALTSGYQPDHANGPQ
ncbi:DUF7344 domain-containing protein [Haloplanus ruber]|uniref:DUF7344 domain-containing protein n=1 Tax=Haloplanus ruber TaxID=869892 RepID=UPI003C6EFFB9